MLYDRDLCRRAYCSAARIRKGIRNVYVGRRTVNRTDRDLIAKLAVGSVRTCLLRRDIIILIDILRQNMQRLIVGKDNLQSVLTGVAARFDPTPAAQNVVDPVGSACSRILNKIIIVNDFYSVTTVVGRFEFVCERQFKRILVPQIRIVRTAADKTLIEDHFFRENIHKLISGAFYCFDELRIDYELELNCCLIKIIFDLCCS